MLARRKCADNDRERPRRHDRCSNSLNHAKDDQGRDIWSQAAGQRGDAKESQARQIKSPLSQISRDAQNPLAAHQSSAYSPKLSRRPAEGSAKIVSDGRKRDIDNKQVDIEHEQPEASRNHREPL